MTVTRFSESFWDSDFISTQGFDVLVQRLKDGRTTSKELEEFVKQRSKIEDDYSKAMFKLSRNALGSVETGSLAQSLVAVRQQLDDTARVHGNMRDALNDLLSRLKQISAEQSNRKKQSADKVKKLQITKKDTYIKMSASQGNHHKKYMLFEQAKALYNSDRGVDKPPRDVEKSEQKMHRCKEDMLKADDQYKDLVDQLETCRQQWESEMVDACDVFQSIEEERIEYLRNELWIYLNIDSVTCLQRDEANEKARLYVEKCNVEKDISEFIDTKKTGSIRPSRQNLFTERIDYVSCETQRYPTMQRPPAPPKLGHTLLRRAESGDADPPYASVSEMS